MNSVDNRNRVGVALLVLRLTVFLVMLIWTIDKFVRPADTASVYENSYFLRGLDATVMCFTLYSLRDLDTLLRLGSPGRSGTH